MKRKTEYRKILKVGLPVLIAILVIIFVFAAGNNDAVAYTQIDNESTADMQNKEIGTWRYKGQIENQSRIIYNNIWGATDDEKKNETIKQYIYYKFNGSFGWEWDRPDPRDNYSVYVTPVFPEVLIGSRKEYSSTPYIPIQLRYIDSLVGDVEYEYVKYPTGEYDLVYDIWIYDNISLKVTEVMIFITGGVSDISVGNVSDGINIYKYYFRSSDNKYNWNRNIFVLNDQNLYKKPVLLHHTVDMGKLFDYLIQSDKLDDNLSLFSIELGNEIWRGTGKIGINKYVINLNNISI